VWYDKFGVEMIPSWKRLSLAEAVSIGWYLSRGK
jgi:hypothetical protein